MAVDEKPLRPEGRNRAGFEVVHGTGFNKGFTGIRCFFCGGFKQGNAHEGKLRKGESSDNFAGVL